MAKLDNELKILIANLERAGVSTGKFKKQIADAGTETVKLQRIADNMRMALSQAERSASGLYQQLRGITSEMKGMGTPLTKATSAFKQLTNQAEKLYQDEQAITDLSDYQARKLLERVKVNKKILKDEAARLANGEGLGKKAAQEVLSIKELSQERGAEIDQVLELIQAADHLSDTQKAILASHYDQHSVISDILDATQDRVNLERVINKNMGVTGALVGGTGALMERLGMRSGIFHQAMKDATEEMRDLSKAAGKNATFLDRMNIAAKGFSIVAKGFSAALRDPAAIVGGIVNGFLDVNKAAVEFTRFTGQTSTRLNGVKTEVASLTDLLKLSAELTKQMGLNAAAIFSPQQTAELADMQMLLGLSVEQTRQLGTLMNLTGKSAKNLRKEIYTNVDAGISQEAVSQDILSTSDDILAAAGGNTKELGKAANAARKLGMNLSQVDKIADGLLDFESSISSELEAQLLTGKNINLAKARELALNNDLTGLAEELSKNGADAAEFANMNRIQQKALADSLGMSREELGKMVLAQANLGTLTDSQKAKIRGVSEEQSRQLDIQQRIQQSVNKLAQAFAPVLEAVVPIVESLLTVVGPIAKKIGEFANTFSGFVKPLLIAVGAFKVIKATMAGIQAIQLAINAAKGVETALNSGIVASLGLQNTMAAVQLAREEGLVGMKAAELVLNETILGSIILQGIQTLRNIPKHLKELGVLIAKAAAYTIANPVAALAGAAAAAGIGALVYSQMNADDMVSPGYGDRTLLGPEGAIQLNNKDTVIAGTNLFGGEGGGGTPAMDTRALEAKLDRLIAAVTAGGNVYLDGNKVGSAQVLGTYKSS